MAAHFLGDVALKLLASSAAALSARLPRHEPYLVVPRRAGGFP